MLTPRVFETPPKREDDPLPAPKRPPYDRAKQRAWVAASLLADLHTGCYESRDHDRREA